MPVRTQTDLRFHLPASFEISEPDDRVARAVVDLTTWHDDDVQRGAHEFVLLPARSASDSSGCKDANVLIEDAISRMERWSGHRFGSAKAPLLLTLLRHRNMDGVGQTVRIDHVGLGEHTLPGLLDSSEDPKRAYAAYTHLILQFARIMPDRRETGRQRAEGSLWALLHRRLDEFLVRRGYRHTGECTAEDWACLSGTFKAMLRFAAEIPFPEDPWSQLWTLLAHWTAEDRYADATARPGVRFIRVAALNA